MSEHGFSFPTRFRGYDRDAVDHELSELHTALEYARADRDRAVARALALEHGDTGSSQVSTTVQWLIDTAEQDGQRIRAEAEQAAAEYTRRAEELLRHRVELVEQAQHEAAVCRAQAAEEARAVVQDTLEKADTLLRGLRESDSALRELFESGALAHRMPPPRHAAEEVHAAHPSGMHSAANQPSGMRASAAQPQAAQLPAMHDIPTQPFAPEPESVGPPMTTASYPNAAAEQSP
jgi:hypothetical protein